METESGSEGENASVCVTGERQTDAEWRRMTSYGAGV